MSNDITHFYFQRVSYVWVDLMRRHLRYAKKTIWKER